MPVPGFGFKVQGNYSNSDSGFRVTMVLGPRGDLAVDTEP